MPQSAFPVIEVITAAITGGGLTKLADIFMSKDSRQVKALTDAMASLSTQLKAADERLDHFGARLREAELMVADCEGKHHDCESNLAELRREVSRLRGGGG